MAEILAAGVLNTLLQPRVPLVRVTRSSGAHSALAANFFTPLPRQSKHKACAKETPPALGHILECQAWSYPPANQSLWNHDGRMRTTLMGEIEPADTRSGVRRTPKSSRLRFSKPLATPEKNSGWRQYHASQSNAAQTARDYSRSSSVNAEYSEAVDEQPVASTSTPSPPPPPSPVALFQEALERGTMAKDFAMLARRFETLEAAGRFAELPSYEVLELADLLAGQIDSLCVYVPDALTVRQWGLRLRTLLYLVDESASPSESPVDLDLVNSLRSRSAAFIGNFEEARKLYEHENLSALQQMNPAYLRLAYTSRVLALNAHQGLAAALQYFFIESSLKRKELGVDALVEDHLLRLFTHDNMRSAIVATSKWESAPRNRMFVFVLLALTGKPDYKKAFDIIQEMRRGSVNCPSNILAEVCEGLVSTDQTALAEKVFHMIPRRNDPNYYALERYVNPQGKRPSQKEAKLHQTITVEEFNETHPRDDRGFRNPIPTLKEYDAFLGSLYASKDYEAGIELWEDMRFHDVRPDIPLATHIMQCLFHENDTLGIMNMLKHLKTIGFKGDNIFYTSIIRYFAIHLDAPAATAVYDDALASGLVPDKWFYRGLMRAYFRAGSWTDAINLFTKLRETAPDVLDIHTYNTVLQGCVYMGAPFKTLVKMFVTLEKQGLIANKYTYGILTQGALDAGQFMFVRDLYRDIMSKKYWRDLVDIAFFTNVVAGYIRLGKRVQAKIMLDTMNKLGIKPTPVTHGAIARAYASWNGDGGVDFAEEYIHDIVTNPTDQSWKDVVEPGMLRKDPLALMYSPIIDKRCETDNVDAAERLVGEFLNNGGNLSVGLLKSLLGMYGRLKRLDDFRSVWNHLLELAVKPYRDQKAENDTFSTKMRPITAPVDIYTQVMSKACCHAELARTWRELAAMKHDFDAGNWHSFAHASLRAGRVENAFQIMEHSLQPIFGNSLRNHFKRSPDIDVPHEEKVAYFMRLRTVPPPRPLHEQESRVRAAHINKAVNRGKRMLTDEQAMAIDFAFPLRLLRKIGPSWHEWKPRIGLLESLLMATMYLEDGFPLRPMVPGEDCAHHIAAQPTEDRGETEVLLKILHENYPRTMHRLRRFRYRETLTLGQYGMKKKYISSRSSD